MFSKHFLAFFLCFEKGLNKYILIYRYRRSQDNSLETAKKENIQQSEILGWNSNLIYPTINPQQFHSHKQYHTTECIMY